MFLVFWASKESYICVSVVLRLNVSVLGNVLALFDFFHNKDEWKEELCIVNFIPVSLLSPVKMHNYWPVPVA